MNKLFKKTFIIALFLALLHNYLFYGWYFGYNVLIFSVIVITAIIVKEFKSNDLRPTVLITSGMVLLTSVMMSLHSAIWLMALNLLVLFICYATLLLSLKPGRLSTIKLSEYILRLSLLPYDLRRAFLIAINRQKTMQKSNRERRAIIPYVRGVAITVPIVFVVIALLSSADSIFAELFSFSLPDIAINTDVMLRLFVFGVVFVIALSILHYLRHTYKPTKVVVADRTSMQDSVEAKIVLITLNVILGIFGVIQIVVLFATNDTILFGTQTYADYARSGFFQLIFATVIVYAVIALSSGYLDIKSRNAIGKKLQLSLIFLLFIVIASAFKRLNLYQSAYGWTTLRLLAFITLLTLIPLLSIMAYKIYYHRTAQWLFPRYGTVLFGAFIFLNLVNPDGLVAARNVDRFIATGKIDTEYLQQMSIDATDQKERFLRIYPDTDTPCSRLALDDLNSGPQPSPICNKRSFLVARNSSTFLNWRESTLSSQHYREVIRQYP